MNLVAAYSYWVIIALWITILATVLTFYFRNRRAFGTTRLLLVVLGLDAIRNLIENGYFGLYFGAKYGLFPGVLVGVLGKPILLILPKLTNIGASCLVLGVLLLRWLPEAIRERGDAERNAEHLHKLATTDSMTGLYNRRQFMFLAETEWMRCDRYRRPLSLLMVDIDHFKGVNDRYGHDVGDRVLTMVAAVCKAQKRNSDISARLGGEEFAILLLETEVTEALLFAERLRESIAQNHLIEKSQTISVTVSIGVAGAAGSTSMAAFLKQADLALYQAKRAGRNRICGYSPLSETG